MSFSRQYRTATEMEFHRGTIELICSSEDTADRILYYFKALAGKTDRNFDDDLDHLFDCILEPGDRAFQESMRVSLGQLLLR